MANTLNVKACADESIVRLQLEDSNEPSDIGAWVQGSWAEASRTAFLDNFSLFQNGNPVTVHRIIAQSTDKADEPNAADLWPHITDINKGEDNTIGNKIEYWIEHAPIDRDATVTWSITKGVVEQGALSNFACTAQAADSNRSLFKVSGTAILPVHHCIAPDANVVFVDPDDGTVPKFPNFTAELGTPTHVYDDLDTIPSADIDGTQNGVFEIDLEITAANPRGIVFEIGDDTVGASLIFTTGNRPRITAKSATVTAVREGSNSSDLTRWPTTATNLTILCEIRTNGQLRLFLEGRVLHSGGNTPFATTWSGSTDGKVGGAEGDYAGSGGSGAPTRSGFNVNQVRYYANKVVTTPVIDSNSKDWYPTGRFAPAGWASISTPIADQINQYIHTASDIPNLENPGSIHKVKYARLAHELIKGQDNLSSNASSNGPKNAAIALKGGTTLGADVRDKPASMHITLGFRPYVETFAGESVAKPFVLFGWKPSGSWGPSDIIQVDMTSTAFNGAGFLNWTPTGTDGRTNFLIQDRLFHVTGLPSQVSKADAMRFQNNLPASNFYIGGMRFDNWPGRGHQIQVVGSNPSGDNSGRVFGEMCWNSLGEFEFRSASLAKGGITESGNYTDITFQKSFYKNAYDPSDVQTHGMGYWKGVTPYMHIKGGWIGAGPGIMFKNDLNHHMIIEDLVGWKARVGLDFGNNGSTLAGLGGTATNRDEWNGTKPTRVVYQNCLISDLQDYTLAMVNPAHCEMRDFVAFSKSSVVSLRYDRKTSTSSGTGQDGGDGWYSGLYRGTIVSNARIEYRVALTDDRSLAGSIGSHNYYISRCLLVFTGSNGRMDFGQEGTLTTAAAAEAAGRNTNYRIRNCHFDFHGTTGDKVRDGANTYTDFDTAKAAVNSGDTFVNCEAGSVTFTTAVSKSTSDDPLLQYFVANGYADYDAVEAAIVDSWAAGWDTVPAPLKTENIIGHFRTALQPTNLDAADYGGDLPGIQSLTAPVAAPTVTTPTSASITTTSAVLGGNVTDEGTDGPITARGVVYSLTSTNANPTIGGTGVTNATTSGTTGVFTVNATGLSSSETYSYRAYATNAAGTSYSEVGSFTTEGNPAEYILASRTATRASANVSFVVDLSEVTVAAKNAFFLGCDTDDGTKGRVTLSDGTTRLAADWIGFDRTDKVGVVRIKWPTSVAVDDVMSVRIYPPLAANDSTAASDTYGSDNAYPSTRALYYPEGAGPDRTANSLDGTPAGSPTVGGVAGQIGNATEFNGTDQAVDLGSSSLLVAGTGPLTFGCWFKYTNAGGPLIGSRSSAGNGYQIISNFGTNPDRIGANLRTATTNGSTSSFGSSANDGTWRQAIMVVDGSTASFYYGGSLVGTLAYTGSINNTQNPRIALNAGFAEYLEATIQEVFFDTAAWTADEVEEEFAQTSNNATYWGTWSAQELAATLTLTDTAGNPLADPVVRTVKQRNFVDVPVKLTAPEGGLSGIDFTYSGVATVIGDIFPLSLPAGSSHVYTVRLYGAVQDPDQPGQFSITTNQGNGEANFSLTVERTSTLSTTDRADVPLPPNPLYILASQGEATFFQFRINAVEAVVDNFNFDSDGMIAGIVTNSESFGELLPGESRIYSVIIDTSTLGLGQTGEVYIDFDDDGKPVDTITIEFVVDVVEFVPIAPRNRLRGRDR
jgi:hypothetical protein